MFKKNFNIHFHIINYWLAFVLLLIIFSNLPHEPAPILSWLNCSIYFFLFLQCFYIYIKVQHNKYIFINLSFFALLHSLSFITPFLGEQHLLGNQFFAFYFFTYLDIIQSFSFVFCVVFICVKYLFNQYRNLKIYALTLAIVLPIFLWHYFPLFQNKEFLLDLLEVDEMSIEKSILYTNFLSLSFVLLYGILLYRYDRSLGEHINTIMVCFFIMTITDITNLFGYIYTISIFSMTQYVLSITLSFFIITMFRLLNYAYSEFGQFYDEIVISGNNFGVPIKRKESASLSLLDFARAYFHQRRNAIGSLTLFFIFCINYFHISLFIKINLGVLTFGLLVLFYYLSALYQKRLKNGNLLNFKRNII